MRLEYHLNMTLKEIQNAVIQHLGSDPTGVAGRIYYNSGDGTVRYYNTAWRSLLHSGSTNILPIGALTSTASPRLFGRHTAGAGAGEEVSLAADLEFSGNLLRVKALTGDVTKAAGATTLEIANDAVTFAKMQNIGSGTILGRSTAGAGDPEALLPSLVKYMMAPETPGRDWAMGNYKITGLADGDAATDAVTLGQLNAVVEGRAWKDPVDAMSLSADTDLSAHTYSAGAGTLTANANGAFPTIDDVAPVAGNDYLILGFVGAAYKVGIYRLTTLGSAGAPWVLTRRADANAPSELVDATVLITRGTQRKGDVYTQLNVITNFTTDAQSWVKTGEGNATYTADGSTLELVGTEFRIKDAGVNLTGAKVTGTLPVASGGTGRTTLTAYAVLVGGTTTTNPVQQIGNSATVGMPLTGTGASTSPTFSALPLGTSGVVSGALPVANGGTGATTPAAARTNIGAVGKAVQLVGNGSATSFNVATPNGATDLAVTVWDVASKEAVYPDISDDGLGAVTVTFGVAPTTNQYRVVVIG
jgi:hypothetical protein